MGKPPEDIPPPRDKLHAGSVWNITAKGFHCVVGLGFMERSDNKPSRAFGKQAAANAGPNKAPSAKNKNGFSGNIHADVSVKLV